MVKAGKDLLIDAIRTMKDDYSKSGNILKYYRTICYLNDDISQNVSAALYKDFKTEKQCVYYEGIFGNGQYTDDVINDCNDVLDTIIRSLTLIET